MLGIALAACRLLIDVYFSYLEGEVLSSKTFIRRLSFNNTFLQLQNKCLLKLGFCWCKCLSAFCILFICPVPQFLINITYCECSSKVAHFIALALISLDVLLIPKRGSLMFRASKRSFMMRVNAAVPSQSSRPSCLSLRYTSRPIAVLRLSS